MGDEAHLGEDASSQRTGLNRRTPGRTGTVAPGEPMRLFVAIAPPPAVLDDLDALAAPLRTGRQDLRWTSREAWHVTLAFLGQVDEVAAARLLRAARARRAPLSRLPARVQRGRRLPRRDPGERALERIVR